MSAAVPSFFVYGEPDRALDVGFVHVETVMARRQIHFGEVAAHKHDRMSQITLWTGGGGRYRIEDRQLDFQAPAVSFVPSGTVHGFSVEPEESDAIVVSMADSALPAIQPLSPLAFERPLMIRDQPDNPAWVALGAVMARLHADYKAGDAAALLALIAVASNDIARLARSGASAGLPEADRLAQRFRAMVDRHYRDNWPVERYVSELASTPHLLAKACHAAFGCSVKAYVDERRLVEAKRLLLFTVHSVEDIAFEIGLNDPAYFSRLFKTRTGLPPSQWRAEHTEGRAG